MHQYELYLPAVLAALTILLLGCWNPKALQAKKGGVATGCPSYMWLALISLLVGLLCTFMCSRAGKKLKLL